jgi:nucleoside-diphosphate-sugar epimerase
VLAGSGAASHTGNGEETARTEEKVRIIKEKARDEDAVFSEAEQRSFPYTIVRPSHTYDNGWIPGCFGSASYGLAWRMLNGLEVVVPGDGQSLWTLTHASDFAVGLVGLLGKREALGQAFHITSDEHLTWDAIHSIIGEALGVQPKIVHIPSDFIAKVLPERGAGLLGDKAVSVLFDNSKIRRFVPEFAPRISFTEGIHRSLAWFDAHPDLKVPDKAMNADMDAILERWQLCAQ